MSPSALAARHVANRLHHGVVQRGRVEETMRRMAAAVDRQNAGDARYRNMAPAVEDGVEFQAALALCSKAAGRRTARPSRCCTETARSEAPKVAPGESGDGPFPDRILVEERRNERGRSVIRCSHQHQLRVSLEGLFAGLGTVSERARDVARVTEKSTIRWSLFVIGIGLMACALIARLQQPPLAQGKLEEAEKAFSKASSLDPKMPEPLGFLGEIQLERGETELALATLERAVEVGPEYFEGYYHLAQAYRRMGRADEARKALALYEELKRKKRGVLSQEGVLALR